MPTYSMRRDRGEMSELKPCPFCGGEAELIWNAIGGFAGCFDEDCPVGPSTATFAVGDEWKSEADAEPHIIDAWNTRAERTCKIEGSRSIDYGYASVGMVWEWDLSCGHTVEAEDSPDYCPQCGARVVE